MDITFAFPIDGHNAAAIFGNSEQSFALGASSPDESSHLNYNEDMKQLNINCNKLGEIGEEYLNVSLQKIEVDKESTKPIVNMKLKVADKDNLAIKRSASACKFKVK